MWPSPGSPRLSPLALLLFGAWGLFGCTSVSTQGSATALMVAGDTKATLHELRTTQTVLALRVPGTLESAADGISTQSTDVVIKRHALLFKIEVVPAFYEALFNADPLAGTLDAWSLSIQLEGYLATGAGKNFFGPQQSLAIDAAAKARQQIEAAARRVVKSPEGFDRARSTVENWVRANPIEGNFYTRPSILPELAKLAAKDTDISVFQAVGDITGTVNDIATRLDIYAAYLPKAGRWQAELLVEQLSDRSENQRVMSTFESVEKMADRVSQLLSPEAIQASVKISMAEVHKEQVAAMAAVDVQRKDTLAYLTQEREAALAALDVQRRNVMADMDRQRAAISQQIEVLRKQALLDVDDVINRTIRRGMLAMAALICLAAGLTWLLTRSVLRPRASGPPRVG
jgi:hypothetical protein